MKKTPIEEAMNIGPASGAELRSIGIDTLEKLEGLGWEEAFEKLCEYHPSKLNLNMLTSLIGAIEKQHWNSLDPQLKAQARSFIKKLKQQVY